MNSNNLKLDRKFISTGIIISHFNRFRQEVTSLNYFVESKIIPHANCPISCLCNQLLLKQFLNIRIIETTILVSGFLNVNQCFNYRRKDLFQLFEKYNWSWNWGLPNWTSGFSQCCDESFLAPAFANRILPDLESYSLLSFCVELWFSSLSWYHTVFRFNLIIRIIYTWGSSSIKPFSKQFLF